MDIALFSVTGLIVYLLSDWIVKMIDERRTEPLQNRQIIFFIVFFGLILLSFEALKIFLEGSG
jgi:surface polysaccharide O-acyltransferase-like enzyme